jgi:hypothetical protein
MANAVARDQRSAPKATRRGQTVIAPTRSAWTPLPDRNLQGNYRYDNVTQKFLALIANL